jgi:hypothetical protein
MKHLAIVVRDARVPNRVRVTPVAGRLSVAGGSTAVAARDGARVKLTRNGPPCLSHKQVTYWSAPRA